MIEHRDVAVANIGDVKPGGICLYQPSGIWELVLRLAPLRDTDTDEDIGISLAPCMTLEGGPGTQPCYWEAQASEKVIVLGYAWRLDFDERDLVQMGTDNVGKELLFLHLIGDTLYLHCFDRAPRLPRYDVWIQLPECRLAEPDTFARQSPSSFVCTKFRIFRDLGAANVTIIPNPALFSSYIEDEAAE